MAGNNFKKTLLAGAAAFLYGTGAYGADVALIEEGGDDGCPKGEVRNDDGKCERDYRKAPDILIVEGSMNTDIRRTEDDPQPYVVFDSEELKKSGAESIEEFIRSRLPMNTSRISTGQNLNDATSQGSLNLRGLGDNQTLILVDGRRLPGISTGRDLRQPNIEGISMASIERIEILPSTSGGIYGGGATGGVINIITKRDYQGLELAVSYGDSFKVDISSLRLDANGGFSLDDGKLKIGFSASHRTSGELLVNERPFVQLARDLQYASNPTTPLSSLPPSGYTTNICSRSSTTGQCSNDPLILDNGTNLNSSITFVPLNYAGPLTDMGAALVENAGFYNFVPPANGASILKSPTSSAFSVNVRRSFGESLEIFGDLRINRTKSEAARGGPLFLTLLAGDAANPFQQDIRITVAPPNIKLPLEYEIKNRNTVFGALFHFSDDWSVGAEYNWAITKSAGSSTSSALTFPGRTYLASIGLQDLNAYQPVFLPEHLIEPFNQTDGPRQTTLKEISGRLTGSLFSLPAGYVTIAASASRRREIASQGFLTIRDTFSFYYPEKQQRVISGYAELNVPIFSERNKTALLEDFPSSYRLGEINTEPWVRPMSR